MTGILTHERKSQERVQDLKEIPLKCLTGCPDPAILITSKRGEQDPSLRYPIKYPGTRKGLYSSRQSHPRYSLLGLQKREVNKLTKNPISVQLPFFVMSICETKTIDSTKNWNILAVWVCLHKFENYVFSYNNGSAITLETHVPTEKLIEVEKSGPNGVINFLRDELITDESIFFHVAEELSGGDTYFEGEELEKMGFETDFFVVDYKVCESPRDVLYAFDA